MIEWLINTIALGVAFIILVGALIILSRFFPEEEGWDRRNR